MAGVVVTVRRSRSGLATTAGSWSEGSVKAIGQAFAGVRCQIGWRLGVNAYITDTFSPGSEVSSAPASKVTPGQRHLTGLTSRSNKC